MELSFVDRIVSAAPSRVFQNPMINKGIDWIGKNISTPENKLILGATALASQPFIDLNNKKVDKKTRQISCYRTVARIIAGTLTGVLIRRGFINLVKHNSFVGKEFENTFKSFFTPSEAKDYNYAYKQYQNSMGTGLALVTMFITNFAIDAPLAKFLTNYLVSKNLKSIGNKPKEVLDGRT